MERVETISNTIKAFISIFDRTFEVDLLSGGEFGSCHSVGWLFFGML